MLLTEFDRYVMEHPKFAAKIPQNAQVVLQVEGDERYNAWSRQLAERQRESGQAVVYVHIRGLKPALGGCLGSMRKGVIARSWKRRSNLFSGQRLLRRARNDFGDSGAWKAREYFMNCASPSLTSSLVVVARLLLLV